MYGFREQVTPGPSEDVWSSRVLQKLQRGPCFLLDITTWANANFSEEESKPAPCEEQSRAVLLQDHFC